MNSKSLVAVVVVVVVVVMGGLAIFVFLKL